MKIKALLMTILLFTLVLVIGQDSFAAIYKYIDKDGMIYFANDLQSVPEQYRPSAKIVSGEAKDEDKERLNHNQPTQRAGTPNSERTSVNIPEKFSAEKSGEDTFGRRALISAIILVSALFAFVILRVLDADHKKIFAITRIVIVWGVSVFLLYAHAGDVIAFIKSAGGKFENYQRQAEEKGKKAANAVKSLDVLINRVESSSSSDPAAAEPENK